MSAAWATSKLRWWWAAAFHAAQAFADAKDIPRATADLNSVLADKEIAAVHICTPNAEHYPMSLAALEAGKAVLCEKPMTMTSDEARKLVAFAKERGLPNCVQHNLRYYPVVQQMREMISQGELGDILIAQGTYSQDWLLYDTDWNWRVDEKSNGALRAHGRHRIALDGHGAASDRPGDYGGLRRPEYIPQDAANVRKAPWRPSPARRPSRLTT